MLFTWWVSKDKHWLIKTDSYGFRGYTRPDDVMEMVLVSAEVG